MALGDTAHRPWAVAAAPHPRPSTRDRPPCRATLQTGRRGPAGAVRSGHGGSLAWAIAAVLIVRGVTMPVTARRCRGVTAAGEGRTLPSPVPHPSFHGIRPGGVPPQDVLRGDKYGI